MGQTENQPNGANTTTMQAAPSYAGAVSKQAAPPMQTAPKEQAPTQVRDGLQNARGSGRE